MIINKLPLKTQQLLHMPLKSLHPRQVQQWQLFELRQGHYKPSLDPP